MTPAASLIVDGVRAGVLLYVAGGALRFKALGAMPADLAARIKAARADVLALLRPPDPAPADGPDTQPAPADAPRAKPAGLLAIVGDAFAPLVLDVVSSDGPAPYVARNPARQPVIDLLLPIFQRDPDRAIALRDEWAERIALCTIDGGQSEVEAEAIAVADLKSSLTITDDMR